MRSLHFLSCTVTLQKQLLINVYVGEEELNNNQTDKLYWPINSFEENKFIFHVQASEVFCKKSCFWKFRKIHKKTSVSKAFLNKVTGLKFAKFLRAPILKNICEQLLLIICWNMSEDYSEPCQTSKLDFFLWK